MRGRTRFVPVLVVSVLLCPSLVLADAWFDAGRAAVQRSRVEQPDRDARARNVILFVGDGMGVSTVTAARILEGQLRDETGEENSLSFERFPHVALSKTYTTDMQVPDSAGTMTAMVTGSKTRSGVLSVDETVVRGDFEAARTRPLETILEQAEARGLSTGVVTTTTLTHATPAAGYAHAPDRNWESDVKLSDAARAAGYPDIAAQLLNFATGDGGDGIEIALGGGRAHFLPAGTPDPEGTNATDRQGERADGRDLTQEWLRRPDAAYVWSRDGLLGLDRSNVKRVLGLFEPSHMQFEADRSRDPGGEPSLAEMTQFAIDVLSRDPEGYVLVVEAGRIDHAHHFSNAFRALHDTLALSRAVQAATQRTSAAETLLIVTADHGHVFTMAGYPMRGNPILGKVKGINPLAPGEPVVLPDGEGRPYTTLGYHNGPGHRSPIPDLSDVDTEAPTYQQLAAIPMRAETHSGEDVPVYASGPGSALVHGVMEQNQIYHVMVAALGWDGATTGRPWWLRWLGR